MEIMFELGFHFQGQYMTASMMRIGEENYKILAIDHEGTAIKVTFPIADIVFSLLKEKLRRA